MMSVVLPWPTWRADLAPEYTIFMPVNNQSESVYQNQVPPIAGLPASPSTSSASSSSTTETATGGTSPTAMAEVELGAMPSAPTTATTTATTTTTGFLDRLFQYNHTYQSMASPSRGAYVSVDSDSAHG
jgi:hypothetical protein